jgi:hypothetical protein
VPRGLADRIKGVNGLDGELLAALRVLVTEYPLEGGDGLKARTGLLEYRYDAV